MRLNEMLESLPREHLQEVKYKTLIVPRANTLGEESDVADNLNSSSNAFGTTPAPPGSIGM